MAGTYKRCLMPRHLLEIVTLTKGFFNESQLYRRSGQKLNEKDQANNNGPDLQPYQTSSTFVLNLENVFIPTAKLGPGNKGNQQ